jgi:hypothetical protein
VGPLVPLTHTLTSHVRPSPQTLAQLQDTEKNWVFFPCDEGSCVIYSVTPYHVVLAVNTTTGVVRPLANSSVTLPAAMQRASWHGGAGAVLLPTGGAGAGRDGAEGGACFLSALHASIKPTDTYTTYLYKFRAEYPYDILSIATVPLPLSNSMTSWAGMVRRRALPSTACCDSRATSRLFRPSQWPTRASQRASTEIKSLISRNLPLCVRLPPPPSLASVPPQVAFVSSLVIHTDEAGTEQLLVSYGSGDREARIFSTPLALLDAFNFSAL